MSVSASLDAVYTKAVIAIGRRLYNKSMSARVRLYSAPDSEINEVTEVAEANLVSSLLPNGMHAPAIDIDLPAYLIPSSTPGHYHLYFEKEMTWKQYLKVLEAMRDAGLVEPGYYDASKKAGASFLRLPSVKKENRAA